MKQSGQIQVEVNEKNPSLKNRGRQKFGGHAPIFLNNIFVGRSLNSYFSFRNSEHLV